MPQQSILDFIAAQGLGWFIAIVLLVPGSMLLLVFVSLLIAKKYLGVDFKTLNDQRERESAQREQEIQSAHDLATEIRLLREQIGQQEEAMWGNRDYTDRQIKDIKQHYDTHHSELTTLVHRLMEQHHKMILYMVKVMKRRTEPVKSEHGTEIFLSESRRRPNP